MESMNLWTIHLLPKNEVHTISTFIIIRYTNNADTLVFALHMSRGKGRGGGGGGLLTVGYEILPKHRH